MFSPYIYIIVNITTKIMIGTTIIIVISTTTNIIIIFFKYHYVNTSQICYEKNNKMYRVWQVTRMSDYHAGQRYFSLVNTTTFYLNNMVRDNRADHIYGKSISFINIWCKENTSHILGTNVL